MLIAGGIRNTYRWFMARFILGTTALALVVLAGATAGSARAQEAERPFLDRLFGPSDQRPAAPIAQDRSAQAAPGDLVVRLDRLENQIRQLTGAIEQLQFRNQQLEGQLRRMQEDTEYRFQELGGKGGVRPPARPPAAQAPTTAMPPTGTVPGKRGDAFDPAQNPNAPGAPQTLGTTSVATATPTDPARGPNTSPPVGAVPSSPKDEFDVAYTFVARKDYAGAEDAFRGFLLKYPSDKLSPEAAYWLGETLFQRQRFRDAAEAFLNVSTKYETSPKAPDALFRLGQSLAALGEKEAACASLGEVIRKFPRASASLKQSVEREQKRVRC